MTIFYDDNENVFIDDFGVITYDISHLMPPEKIALYKRIGGTYYSRMFDADEVMYEITFPIRDKDRHLYYYADDNTMHDEDDYVAFNILNIMSSNDLFLFKKGKKDMLTHTISGGILELTYKN